MKTGPSRTTVVIVMVVTGIVVAPVLVRGFPREVARWHLAAAANALHGGDEAAAELSLERAMQWNPNIAEDHDYWWLRVKQAYIEGPESLLKVLKETVAFFPNMRYWLGNALADQYADEGDFKNALGMVKFAYGEKPLENANELNQVAYFRALAGEDLDLALEEINRALKLAPKEPALIDTRGWVLFQMGRLSEALVDAEVAVKAMDNRFKFWNPKKTVPSTAASDSARANSGAQSGSKKTSQATSGENASPKRTTLTRQDAGTELWGLGALRFHRAKILESLGRQAEADRDFQWLRDWNLPLDNRLF